MDVLVHANVVVNTTNLISV